MSQLPRTPRRCRYIDCAYNEGYECPNPNMNTFKPDSDCHKMPIPDIVKMLDEEAKTSVTECHACDGDGYLPSNGFDEAKVCNVCEGSGNLD